MGGFSPKDWFLGPQEVIFCMLHLLLYNMVRLVKKSYIFRDFLYFLFYVYKKCVPADYAILAYVDSTFALLDIAILIQI